MGGVISDYQFIGIYFYTFILQYITHGFSGLYFYRLISIQFGVLGIFPRKRTKASVAPAISGLPDGVTSHFLTVLEYFG